MVFLSSCGLIKNKKNFAIVKGKIEIHKPYCGGAKPNEEQLKGYFEPYSNSTFIIKKQMNNDKELETISSFSTNENGEFELKIPKGKYIVIHEDKVLSFDQYIQKLSKTTDKFLKYIGDKDAKMQFESIDFFLEVEGDKTFQYAFKSRCFSGINPLLRYDGPKPQ